MMKKNRLLMVATFMLPLLFFCLSGNGQGNSISGIVTDETNNPMPGVNVVIKGTTTGTVANPDGEYQIAASSDDVLVFSFIGYQSKEVKVGNQTELDVSLSATDIAMDDVVVIGYGTQRKEAVTGSVASVGGDDVREVASANITQSLKGRIAGVEFSQTSTKPGAEMQIRIRGTRSLSADNDPLIVLNGIPFAGSIGEINPNDIKSVDILKDASATAIYGSRGANGVILITTYTGRKGQAAKVSYNGYVGFKNAIHVPMMNGPEFAKLRTDAGKFNNTLDESDDVDTDWQELMYRTAMVTSQDVSVLGGSENGTYSFGIGYYRDESVIPEQDYERFSLRASVDQEIGAFRLGLTTNSNFSVNMGDNLGMYNTLSSSPLVDPYDENGELKRDFSMPLDDNYLLTKEVVEGLGDSWIDQTKRFGSYNVLFGEVKIPGVRGLKLRTNLGLDFKMTNDGEYRGEGVFSNNPQNNSSASIGNSLTTHWTTENMITYDRLFAGKHKVDLIALFSAEESMYNSSYISAKNIPSDHFQFYNLGHAPSDDITIDPNNQNYERWGLMSWMGRAMYSYDNKYMLSVAIRSDGSSRLSPGMKWHTYPAISTGWNLMNEDFMKDVSFIDALKLRVGYGQTSNQSIDPYATLGRLGIRPYNFGDNTYAVGTYVTELPNDAGWEYSSTINLGLDFTLFNNRLSGTFEYYKTNTKDILLDVKLPRTAGVSSYTDNIGETQNQGVELSLNGTIIDNNNGFTWEAGVNFYANRNKLVALASGMKEDLGNWWFVGHPIDVIYDYKMEGLWQEDDPYFDILEPGKTVGSIKVEYTGEYNEDGTPVRQINADDRQPQSIEPDFMGGFDTRLSYKGLDLTIVGSFRSGGTLISSLYSSAGYLNMMTGRRNNVKVDYWTPENTDAKYPNPLSIDGDNPDYGKALGYFDASYLKVRAITLGYNFESQNWLKKAGIKRLRIYATAQNPFVMFSPYHKESGMDPEPNSYGNQNVANSGSFKKRLLIVGTNTPASKNYLFGVNLTF